MRTLGIDLGTRRVGLAMSDEGGRFATPVQVLQVRTPEDAAEQVLKVVRVEQVARLLVGLPLNMDGSTGPAARDAARWAKSVAAAANIPLVLVDERLSSFDAEQQLNERRRGGERLTHKKKKERLDAIAAAGFLQAFLDGKLQGIEPDID